MNYSKRIKIAAVFSILIHAAGFALLRQTYSPDEYIPAVTPEPIVLDLQPDPPAPPEPDAPKQFVEVTQPAEVMPEETDRIAEVFSEATDQSALDDNSRTPALETGEFDVLPKAASAPAPPEPPAPEPAPRNPDTEEPQEKKKSPPEEEQKPENKPDPGPPLKSLNSPVKEVLPETGVQEPSAENPEAPIRIAQATMPQRPEAGTSRERGGVAKEGDTNFDAIQSEIAPYLKHIRKRVEQQWNQMLYTRYSGTSPVKAVIDCAIDPEGNLVSVSVVGTENDKLYSALCRDAVQRAGPFGAFPFEVPDIYQGKNLEIRWTFSFL